jgi:hypothetical protein
LLGAAVFINAGAGTSRLQASDAANFAATATVVTSGSIEEAGVAPILYTTAGTFDQVLLRTGQGNNTVNVRSTLAAAAETRVQAGAGNDVIVVSTAPDATGLLAFLGGRLVVDAGAGANNLAVSDQADFAMTPYTILTNSSVERPDGVAPIIYTTSGTFNQVLFRMGQGGNFLNVRSTTAAAVETRVETGAGNDSIAVSTTADSTGSLAFLAGQLAIDAGAGANNLSVSDMANPGTTPYNVLTNTSLERPDGVAPILYSTSGTFNFVQFRMGQGGNFLNVRSTLAAAGLTQVQTGAGNDAVVVSTAPDATGSLAFLGGSLAVDAGAGANTLAVSDQADFGPTPYTILTDGSIERSDGIAPIIYSTSGVFNQVQFRMGQGGNFLNVRSTLAAAAETRAETGAGNDAVVVSTMPDATGSLGFLGGRLFLDTGAGANSLAISDQANPGITPYTVLTNASLERPDGVAPVIYTTSGTFSSVQVRLGQGGNTFNVRSTLQAAASTQLMSGNGQDDITVSTATPPSLSSGSVDPSQQIPLGTVGLVQGPLAIDAQGGANQLLVNDGADQTGNVLNFTANTIASVLGLFAPITYAASNGGTFSLPPDPTKVVPKNSLGQPIQAGLIVLLGQASNELDLFSQLPGSSTYVGLGTLPATNVANVSVASTSGYQDLTVDLGNGFNFLRVNDVSGGAQARVTSGAGFSMGTVDVTYPGGLPSHITYFGALSVGVFSGGKQIA